MSARKVIIDTDFATLNDDGQALIMAAQLHRAGVIDLLALTIVSGNDWLAQEVSDALRAVERLGLAGEVGIHPGANRPLVHDPGAIEAERALFGFGDFHRTAFHKPEPGPADIVPPFDGFARGTRASDVPAALFLAETVRANPGAVTIVTLGPMTNLALAIRTFPDIVPKIGRVVSMAGALEVPGNTTPAAEMNIWFDPEAARIVFREPLDHLIVPLDVTGRTLLRRADYERIAAARGLVPAMFRKVSRIARRLAENPEAASSLHDTVAIACLAEPAIATEIVHPHVDVDIAYGPGYGRTLAYWPDQPTALLKRKAVVRAIDERRFFDLYVDLMTRPIPGAETPANEDP